MASLTVASCPCGRGFPGCPARQGPNGDPAALVDIPGEDLSYDPNLGRAVLWRRRSNGDLERSVAELQGMQMNSASFVETGLWHAAAEGWRAAANWFDRGLGDYEGDGVVRVHRQRAHVRAGDAVDWSLEHERFPNLLPVILTEERGEPVRLDLNPEDPDLGEEQRQDLWFNGLVYRDASTLRDWAEEDLLAARHLL